MTTTPKRWQLRRRITCGTLAYCAAAFTWLICYAPNDELHKAALEIIGILALGVIGSYTGAKTALNIKEGSINARNHDSN